MSYARSWSTIFALLLTLASAVAASGCSDDGGSAGPTDTGGDDQGTDGAAGDVADDGQADGGGGDVGDGGGDDIDEPDLPTPIGDPVTVPVGDVFAPGTALRDGYGGDRAVVDDEGNLTIIQHPNGVLLLERDQPLGREAEFSWDNATVYFIMTDRFENGNSANDNSYGRQPAPGQAVGTWHGGDFAGITQRLDYIDSLGINAIWISPPFEQIHGWVGGGNLQDFQHYAYAGYWIMDWTELDANFGTEQELATLIEEAHDRGIRVVFDVVMNHPGYATLDDLADVLPSVLTGDTDDWSPGPGQNWGSFNDLIDFGSEDWVDWWGPRWIRAGFPLHCQAGSCSGGQSDLTCSLAFLPDFFTTVPDDCGPAQQAITELPGVLQNQASTSAVHVEGWTVRDYLIDWLTHWVREYGIDGFRVDTAKHVELEAWRELHDEATAAFEEWKEDNPADVLDDSEFWMTAEVFPSGVTGTSYHTEARFDSTINFDFQPVANTVASDMANLEPLYNDYATRINGTDVFNVLSYISSHDTHLFFERHGNDVGLQRLVGTALMLLPGGVQVYYGDETARPGGPSASEAQQSTRSDMNWSNYDEDLLDHWQRLGRFRNRHVAVGAGTHRELTYGDGYMFAREYEGDGWTDEVIVVLDQ